MEILKETKTFWKPKHQDQFRQIENKSQQNNSFNARHFSPNTHLWSRPLSDLVSSIDVHIQLDLSTNITSHQIKWMNRKDYWIVVILVLMCSHEYIYIRNVNCSMMSARDKYMRKLKTRKLKMLCRIKIVPIQNKRLFIKNI